MLIFVISRAGIAERAFTNFFRARDYLEKVTGEKFRNMEDVRLSDFCTNTEWQIDELTLED
jgi:hypothetical protein